MNTAERDKFIKEIAEFIKEPDGLISRLDERTLHMCKDIEELKEHQARTNGSIQEVITRSTKNSTWITVFRWLIYVGVPAIILLITRSYGLW